MRENKFSKRGARHAVEPYLLSLRVRPLGDGRYVGRCADLPGLLVEGESIEEVLRLAPKVAKALIEAMREKGVELPRTLASVRPPMSVTLVVAA